MVINHELNGMILQSRGQNWEDQGTVYKISLKSETIQFFFINIPRHNKFLGRILPGIWSRPASPVVRVNVLRWNLDLHRKALDKGDRDGSLRKWSDFFSAG